jgi:hypothetical protein
MRKCTDEFVLSSNMIDALPFSLLLQLTLPEQETAQVYLNDARASTVFLILCMCDFCRSIKCRKGDDGRCGENVKIATVASRSLKPSAQIPIAKIWNGIGTSRKSASATTVAKSRRSRLKQ